jgi:glycosyltransferase involved in cell wall biosynthesis
MFLARTVRDVLAHAEGDTEVIVVLDGPSPHEPPPDDPRVRVVQLQESIGQRAACNLAARMSEAKYVMKLDAHCSVSQGFDVAMMADMQADWTAVPVMRNLHVFNWLCPNGHRRYQGQSGPCQQCGEPTEREIVWISKTNPQSTSYCFDAEPHFQYFGQFKARPEGRGDLTETMSLQGSCWMLTREKYWELEICDEAFGSWGSQGLEVAVKTWLSGGRVIVNHKTFYAHAFRTAGGDWSFPYTISGKQVEHAKSYARDLFFNNKWPKQIHSLSWLIEKFWPVPGWSEVDLASLPAELPSPTVGLVYYTDNRIDPAIMAACQKQIEHCRNGHELVSVSLKPIAFGRNITLEAVRGPLTMFRQILAGLEACTADVVFFCEHDCLYHPSHFEFRPLRKDIVYYDSNFWQVDSESGHALTHVWRSTSGLCAYRELLLQHYRRRVQLVEERGFSMAMGHEPGTHHRPERVDDLNHEMWRSAYPSIDIRHGQNLTPAKWRKEDFRSQRYTEGWQESETIPGWGAYKEVINGIT